jgi:hypothetical protein
MVVIVTHLEKKRDVIFYIFQIMHATKKCKRDAEKSHVVLLIKMTSLMRTIMRRCRRYMTLAYEKINNKSWWLTETIVSFIIVSRTSFILFFSKHSDGNESHDELLLFIRKKRENIFMVMSIVLSDDKQVSDVLNDENNHHVTSSLTSSETINNRKILFVYRKMKM